MNPPPALSASPPVRAREHGAVAIEFLIVLPVFLALAYGVIQASALAYGAIVVRAAAEDASHAAAVCTADAATCRTRAETKALDTLRLGRFMADLRANAAVTPTHTDNADGTRTEIVTVSTRAGLPLVILGGRIEVSFRASSSLLREETR